MHQSPSTSSVRQGEMCLQAVCQVNMATKVRDKMRVCGACAGGVSHANGLPRFGDSVTVAWTGMFVGFVSDER